MDRVTIAPALPEATATPRRSSGAPRWLTRPRLLAVYLAINAPLMVGILLAPFTVAALARGAVALLASAALVTGLLWRRTSISPGWGLIVAGGVAGTTAPIIFATTWMTTRTNPDEWVGPAIATVAIPLFIAGMVRLGRHSGRRDTSDLLDATVVALAVFLVLFALVIHPALPPDTDAAAGAIIFPLGALLLFAAAVWVALSVGVPTRSIGLLLLAVLFGLLATTSLLIPGIVTGSITGSRHADGLFAAYFITLAAALLHPSLDRLPTGRPHPHASVSRRRMALLALLAVTAPIAWGGEILRTTGVEALNITVPLIVSAVLFLVVVARLGLTARMAQRRAAELSQRSEDLAQAVRDQERLQRQLRHQATHDPLTGLPNRIVLAERMEWALSRPTNGHHTLAVIDLDHFKDVNDTFGHTIGDKLLVEVSHRILATMPPGATLARFGGDEFAALLEHTAPTDAAAWSEQVRQSLRQPYRIGGHRHYLSASIGLLTTEPERPPPTPSEALRDADLALYAAKTGGKDRAEAFRPELRTSRTDHRWLRTGLQAALARDELLLHYQPVVDLDTGRIVAAEALLRWAPSGQPPLPPSSFIPVAEEEGLINPIGAWAMRRACRDAASWYVRHGVAVTVNVSPHQLGDAGFADMVTDALEAAGLPPAGLILEITETSLVATSATDQAMDQLYRLRERGVRVAIDDFGTGYSSLANVARLPVDIVKIDSAFVQNPEPFHDAAESWAFTRAILHMVQALHLQAIAEGVETLEQAEALQRLRCPLAQGYLFARPMEPTILTQTLAESAHALPVR
jgi:diguanylate cyclase